MRTAPIEVTVRAMTDALAKPATPPRPPLADGRPEPRPAEQDGAADAITTALTAIAHAIPAHLLAPWLPAALGTLSRRGGAR